MKPFRIALLAALFFCVNALAGPPILIDRQTGKYLGELSDNPYAPDSISNPYGRFGNPYSADSVNNPYGRFGSPYSNDSINNPYARNPPIIIFRR